LKDELGRIFTVRVLYKDNLIPVSKGKVGVFFDFKHVFTFNIITFSNRQVESFKRHHKKLELMMLNFIKKNSLQL
jgi:hypothetical protein